MSGPGARPVGADGREPGLDGLERAQCARVSVLAIEEVTHGGEVSLTGQGAQDELVEWAEIPIVPPPRWRAEPHVRHLTTPQLSTRLSVMATTLS